MTREEFVRKNSWVLGVIRDRCGLTQAEKDYLDHAIEYLGQEPCEKTQMVDKSTFSQEQYRADLQSAFDCGKASAEPCKDCVSREFVEIVVNYPPADLCAYPEYKGKPYFSIKYQENGKDYVGFGTYKIEILSQWLKEYFMSNIQPNQKMGRWLAVDNEDMYTVDYFCSECDLPLETAERTPFCPNCGAKMEVEENG